MAKRKKSTEATQAPDPHKDEVQALRQEIMRLRGLLERLSSIHVGLAAQINKDLGK